MVGNTAAAAELAAEVQVDKMTERRQKVDTGGMLLVVVAVRCRSPGVGRGSLPERRGWRRGCLVPGARFGRCRRRAWCQSWVVGLLGSLVGREGCRSG